MNAIFDLPSYFGNTELHIYDLVFETDVGKSEGMSLFLSFAWTEVLEQILFDKYLVHLEPYVMDAHT